MCMIDLFYLVIEFIKHIISIAEDYPVRAIREKIMLSWNKQCLVIKRRSLTVSFCKFGYDTGQLSEVWEEAHCSRLNKWDEQQR